MQHLSNRQFVKLHAAAQAPLDWVPYPYVDTLYDFTQFLSPTQPIATFPTAQVPVDEVAVVGAGAAGMAAAFELLRAGVKPTVFEATDRIGGRTWSLFFEPNGSAPPLWAEMGAMRFPPSSKLFWYYANQFGAQQGAFPDPGIAPTVLYYQNKAYRWVPHKDPPGPFKKIQDDFGGFIQGIANSVWTPWYNNDRAGVIAAWQSLIAKYANLSVYDAVKAGIPQWTNKELNAFSALGVGSGGFGTLYRVGNLELLRNTVNKWEFDQQLIVGWKDDQGQFVPEGINGLTSMLFRRKVALPNGPQTRSRAFEATASLESSNAVRLNARVTRIEREPGSKRLRVHWVDTTTGKTRTKAFGAVIVAVPTRAMEIDLGLTLPAGREVKVGSEDVKNAMRTFYLIGSSKLMIRTKTKFWLDAGGKPRPDIPQTIQTDELPRGVYCLDYPHTHEGVVLISYTWGDDSTKLTAVEPAARFRLFKEILTRIHPAFGANLVPARGERDIVNVDWEATPHYYGAFKLQLPGQDPLLQAAYYQFLSVLNPARDPGVYLAGDSVSYSGGWVEGALQTGINAAAAAAKRLGGTLRDNSPLTQNASLYRYDK